MTTDNDNIENFGEELLDGLRARGASDAEILISQSTARQVTLQNGEIETAESATSNGISLRAYIGQQTASMNLSFDQNADLSNRLDDLILAAKASPADPYAGIAAPEELANTETQDFDQFDPHPLLSIDELYTRARELEAAAKGAEVRVDQSGTSHGHLDYYYVASNGLRYGGQRSSASQSVVAIHEGSSLVRDYAQKSTIHLADLEDPSVTGARAYSRTFAARNPVRPPSGKYPVLFHERVASSLLSHVLGAMNGAAIARRASWLIDYEEAILPLDWALIETPFRLRKSASAVHDGEGLAKAETRLIADGRAQLWLANLAAARQLEITPTGHAQRSGVSTGTGIGMARLDAPGTGLDALLADMGEGLLVTGFIGATINPHTGDYSRGVNGFWVKNGEIQYAVNEATIAGNLKTMLPGLRAGDDAEPDRNLVVPSLLVAEMTIAGA